MGSSGRTPVGGPFDCIDDHVEKAYLDDAKVNLDFFLLRLLVVYNAVRLALFEFVCKASIICYIKMQFS